MSEPPSVLDSPEEVLSTLRRDGHRRWIYPVVSKGAFFKKRLVVGWALIATFVAFPLIPVGGHPAILLDVVHREFHFFGLTLYPTDTLLLMLFVLTALVGIFLFTSLLGRVWCGWACPQTVYLEFVFRPIETLFEGKPNQRRRRDEGPTSMERTVRKAGKWAAFTLVALAMSHVFVAYFVGWDALLQWMTGSPSEHWGFFVIMAGTTGLILFDFGMFREQMCTITCPYARFQSVLLDRDSLIVSYDPGRGEPRGRRSRKQRQQEKQGQPIDLGDCIDCGACVRTCPTGIDIRHGLQMECVSCTQCADACDAIMDGIGKPRGLVRYTSENLLEGHKPKPVRTRVVAYTLLLTALTVAFFVVLGQRTPIEVNIGRVVGAPFTELPDGRITNRLRFRIQNRTADSSQFHIEALEPANLEIKVVGRPSITVPAGQTQRVEAWVVSDKDVFQGGKSPARFRVTNDSGVLGEADFTLLGP